MKRNRNITIFDDNFVDARVYYLNAFNELPCISYIGDVDVTKIFEIIASNRYGKVLTTLQRNYYDRESKRIRFTKTLFKISGNLVIRLGDDWADIYFSPKEYERANNIINEFSEHRMPAKETVYEINIITMKDGSLDLKTLPIRPTKLDICLYYNDDFASVDAVIRGRLTKENDKGIVLLHGLPGTGKTTYLRNLVGSLTKKVLFVSPGVAVDLRNPEFTDLLIENPNSVLIIEDAENIVRDRKFSGSSSVSNLLNLSDGLLSDCLNVQIICTFNSELNSVDSALLRKGRLIACYEFGKLHVHKAKALSEHLGFTQIVNRPMTLAEVMNPNEKAYEISHVEVIGFKRNPVIN